MIEAVMLLIIPAVCFAGCVWSYIQLVRIDEEDESERYDFFEEQICRTTERLMEGGADE